MATQANLLSHVPHAFDSFRDAVVRQSADDPDELLAPVQILDPSVLFCAYGTNAYSVGYNVKSKKRGEARATCCEAFKAACSWVVKMASTEGSTVAYERCRNDSWIHRGQMVKLAQSHLQEHICRRMEACLQFAVELCVVFALQGKSTNVVTYNWQFEAETKFVVGEKKQYPDIVFERRFTQYACDKERSDQRVVLELKQMEVGHIPWVADGGDHGGAAGGQDDFDDEKERVQLAIDKMIQETKKQLRGYMKIQMCAMTIADKGECLRWSLMPGAVHGHVICLVRNLSTGGTDVVDKGAAGHERCLLQITFDPQP
jgi:hypothetical protein